MIIERLSQRHHNVLRGCLPSSSGNLRFSTEETVPTTRLFARLSAISEVYPEVYHHPQEDLVFATLKSRNPIAAAKVGDLAGEHHKGA